VPKVVLFSDLFLTTFPQLEIPLFRELCRSVETKFVLQEGDYRLITPGLRELFAPIATVVRNPKKDLLGLVGKDDLCVMRFGYKGLVGDVASALRAAGRRILMLDPAAIDLKHRECPAQYVTAKSEWLKRQVPGRYKDVFVTGTIHFDAAFGISGDRKAFMESYGLDPSKRLVILTPANPAELGHQKGVNREYHDILETLKAKCPDCEVLVKGHPMDYTAALPAVPGIIHKNQHYANKHSWESFYPGVRVVKAEEGYLAFKLADVVVNVRSSIAMETPLFPTPLINVNRHKYLTNWPVATKPGVMQDVKLEDLARTTNNLLYNMDHEACKEYVRSYCGLNDGNAYERTAQAAINILSR
jgi:hypothetical protein